MPSAPATYRTQGQVPATKASQKKLEEGIEEELPSCNKTPEQLLQWMQKRLTASVVQGGRHLVKTDSMEVVATQIVVQKLGSRSKEATSTQIASAVEHGQDGQGKLPLYDCAVRCAWFGRFVLDGRTIGEATGVVDIREVSSADGVAVPSAETCEVKCFCEFKRWAGSHDSRGRKLEAGDPAALAIADWGREHKPREIDDVETQLRDAVNNDGVPKILAKVRAFQQDLAQLEITHRNLKQLPDPAAGVGEEDEEVQAAPEVQAFIDKITVQNKGNRYDEIFLKALGAFKDGKDGSSEEELKFDFCNIDDADLGNFFEVLKDAQAQNQGLVKLDLSNNKIKDAGIQTLIMALAGGMLPQLMQLNLKGNAFTVVGANMLKGLSMLRKKMNIAKD